MKLKDIITSEEMEKSGVWRFYEGGEFQIAAANNPAHTRAIAKHSRGVSPGKIRNDPNTAAKITIEAMADGVLMNWRGEVEDENSVQMPVTRENKIKLLKIRSFREWVSTECMDAENFKMEAQAEDAQDLKSGGEVESQVEQAS